jgi:hypothetical protein
MTGGTQVLFTNFLLNLDAVLMPHPSQSKNYKPLRSQAAMSLRQNCIFHAACIV